MFGGPKQKSLGYADAFAAELAIERSHDLVTADSEFSRVGQLLSIYSLPLGEVSYVGDQPAGPSFNTRNQRSKLDCG
jgi:hypothetical protein